MALVTYRSSTAREIALAELAREFEKNALRTETLHCANATATEFVDRIADSEADILFVLDPDRLLFGENNDRSPFWVNFQRETLVSRPGVQIWWLRPVAAIRFGQQLPDLSRFFLFREDLSDEEPVQRLRDLTVPAPITGDGERGRDLLRRALLAAADSAADRGRIWLELGIPAAAELIRAGLHTEAAEGLDRLSAVANPPDPVLGDLAKRRPRDAEGGLAALGEIYNDLVRFENAMPATSEAIRLQRLLAKGEPDIYQPRLARSLNNLANAFFRTGQPDRALPLAEEAVRIERELVKNEPMFLAGLAGSLISLANVLSALGRRQEALSQTEEAVRVYRQLARGNPDAFGPDLAGYLSNLANQLGDLGRTEEALAAAEEAVQVYSKLSADLPANDLLPTLLDNLAKRLGYAGRLEEALVKAEEATRIRRILAQRNPVLFLPDLAKSLNNAASILLFMNRPSEALPLAKESVGIHRELAGVRPDAFLHGLAMSLNNLARALGLAGRPEEALDCADNAVRIFRGLGERNPDVFLPELAKSLENLASRLRNVGHANDALISANEALGIYRELARQHPGVFVPDLARSLAVRGQVAASPDEAVSSLDEAIRLLTPLVRKHPLAHMALFGAIRLEYLKAAKAAGVTPDPELMNPESSQKSSSNT
jgi:tetratricopeptide (TPR) repeat protein